MVFFSPMPVEKNVVTNIDEVNVEGSESQLFFDGYNVAIEA